MDQFTRRIVGFGIQRGMVDGPIRPLCTESRDAKYPGRASSRDGRTIKEASRHRRQIGDRFMGFRNAFGKLLKFNAPEWRNWHTQQTQNLPVLSTVGVQVPPPASCFFSIAVAITARG